MNHSMRRCIRTGFGLLVMMAVAAPVAAAEEAALPIEQIAVVEVEVSRDAAELQALLRPRPDADRFNTVLAFNNSLGLPAVVRCVAYGIDGRPLGRTRVKVPGNGLRFVLASDFAHGRDFVGSARCSSAGRVVPAAFIVGQVLTDTPASSVLGWPGTKIRFPVVVTH